jgi:hypothetical protein
MLAIGFCSFLVKKRHLAVGMTVTMLAVLTASALHKYPSGSRLLYFVLPVVYLLLGEGLQGIQTAALRLNRVFAWGVTVVLMTVLLYNPMLTAVRRLVHPDTREEIKPVLAHVAQRASPNNRIYVYFRALPAFTYYAPSFGLDGMTIIEGIRGDLYEDAYLAEINRLRGGEPVWLVFTDNCPTCRLDEHEFLKYARRIGSRRDSIRAPGAAAFLYRLRTPKRRSGPSSGN